LVAFFFLKKFLIATKSLFLQSEIIGPL